MNKYNNPREYKNEIAKYIEILGDLKQNIEWLSAEFPDTVLIWRADILEERNELCDDYERDLSKYSWQIWAELEDIRDQVIKVAGVENYKKYVRHNRSFDEMNKWIKGEITSEEMENNINKDVEL